ncbi:MAG TPA: polyamine aminopropyltransferase [Candidatus Hypogeohydataceae bacterium YC41]
MTEFQAKKDLPSRWFRDYFNPYEHHEHALKGILYTGRSAFQEIVVAETLNFGRCLILDNEVQCAERDEFIYHEALIHPALALHPCPKRVAIIGGGEGASLRETLRHKTVEKAVMVDIDREVVECAKRYLPTFHNGAFADRRSEVLYMDGRKYLEDSKEPFDAVIIDINCPMEGGPAYMLFTKEFYSMVKERLTDQGVLAVQADNTSPAAFNTFTTVANTLKQVFPGVFPYTAYVPFFALMWGFCLATKGQNPLELSPEEIDRRISQRVQGQLRYYDGITHHSILNLPKYLREAIKAQTKVNTDSHPIIEKYPGMGR